MSSPTLTTRFDFYTNGNAAPDGASPVGGLAIDAQGNLYGAAEFGGAYGQGALFEFNPATSAMTTLESFSLTTTGAFPVSAPTITASGALIGDTVRGGILDAPEGFGYGTVYQYSPATSSFTLNDLLSPATPDYPTGNLVLNRYGVYDTVSNQGTAIMTYVPGINVLGEIPIPPSFGWAQGNLLASNSGAYYLYGVAGGPVGGLGGAGGGFSDGDVFGISVSTGQPTIIASFNGANGMNPVGGLVADAAGNLYGATSLGGAYGDGTVFELNPNTGVIAKLADFNAATGFSPTGSLLIDAAGNLFGENTKGGAGDNGTVFEVNTTTDSISTLASFAANGNNGASPYGGLVADAQGNLYGTTASGGLTGEIYGTPGGEITGGLGTIFEITNSGYVVSDPGPTTHNATIHVGTGEAYDVASYLQTLVTPGLAGDTETVTAVSGNAHLAGGPIFYYAPTNGLGDSFTYTVTDQNGLSSTSTITVVEGAPAATVVHLNGYNDSVNASIEWRQPSTGVAGATIDGPLSGGAHITGTHDNITINAHGYGNYINANGGADTINTGSGGDIVTVSDFSANNVVTGGAGNAFVQLGSGNNTIALGGYNNSVWVSADLEAIAGGGNNTIDMGQGNANVTTIGGVNSIVARGYYNTFNLSDGVNTLTGMAGYSTINVGASFNTSSVIDLTGFTGSMAQVGGVWELLQPDGELFATVNLASGIAAHLIGDGHSGEELVYGAPTPPTPPTHLIETMGGLTIALSAPTTWLTTYGYNNTVTGGDTSYLIDGDLGGTHITLGNGNDTLALAGWGDNIVFGNGNDTVSGASGGLTLQVGDGNNTIVAGGVNNRISVGVGTNTINAGVGNELVVVGGGHDAVTMSGNNDELVVNSGNVTLTGAIDNATIVFGLSFTGSSSLDLPAFTGTQVLQGDVWRLINPDGSIYATIPGSVAVHLVSDGHGGQMLIPGAPPAPVIPAHIIETAPAQTVALTSATNWLTLDGTGNTVTGGDTGTLVDGDQGGSHITLGNGNDTLHLAGWGDTIILGNGSDVIDGLQGNNVITAGNGNNSIALAGYGNRVSVGTGANTIATGTGGATVTLGYGTDVVTAGGYYDVFNIAGGAVTLSGMADYAQINIFSSFDAGSSIDLAGFTGSMVASGDVWQLVKADGEIYATLGGSVGVHLVADGHGGEKLVYGAPAAPVVPTNVVETSGGQTVTVNTSTQSVTLFGYSNTVTGAGGSLTINGDAGGSTFNLSSGNNTLLLGGYGDTISLDVGGGGNNTVVGTLGNTTIHTGDGNQTIVAHGYNNSIVLGNGNSSVSGIDGSSTVTVGSASVGGTITLAGGGNTVNLGGSFWTVTAGSGGDTVNCGTSSTTIVLAGWNNVVTSTLGNVTVNGAWGTDFKVNGDGLFNISNFSAGNGDVLDLSGLTIPMGTVSVTGIADSFDPTALDVVVTTLGVNHLAAILHGANASLASLVASHNILL